MSRRLYKLAVGYRFKDTNADDLQKLIKRNAVSATLNVRSKQPHLLHFKFKQSTALNRAVGRLRESGLNIRFLSEKVENFNVTSLPAASNCRKL